MKHRLHIKVKPNTKLPFRNKDRPHMYGTTQPKVTKVKCLLAAVLAKTVMNPLPLI